MRDIHPLLFDSRCDDCWPPFSTNHQLVSFETKFWRPIFTIIKAYTYLDFVRKKLTFVPIIDGTLRPGNLILRPENECSASNYSNILVSTLPIFPLLPQPDFFKFHLRRMSQSIYLLIINSIDFCEKNWSFDIFINWMWKWYLACVCVCTYALLYSLVPIVCRIKMGRDRPAAQPSTVVV